MGLFKGEGVKNNPRTADAFKTEIRNIVRSINGDELQRVFRNLMTRCEA
jgi:transposase